MKKRPIGRIIASIIAGLLMIAGIYFLVESYQYRQKFYRWQEARPIDIAVDLSKPGEFSGKFHQTCQTSHGETLYLEMPANALDDFSVNQLLENLRFNGVIIGAQGEIIEQFDSDEQSIKIDDDDAVSIVFFEPFKNGEYTLIFTVQKGVPELAGISQRLVAKYQLCGLELFPAFLSAIIGGILVIVASVILLFIIAITKQNKSDTTSAHSPGI